MRKIKEIRQFNFRTSDPSVEPSSGFLRAITRFDKMENVIAEIIYEDENQLESKTEYKFDDKNRLTEKVTYLAEDQVGEKFSYFYNENNQIIKEIQFFEDGSLSCKIYEYSADRIILTTTDEDDNLEGKEIRILENGKLTEEMIFDENENIIQRTTYSYNEKGQIITRTEFNENNEISARRNYTYNPDGELTEVIELTGNGEIISHRNYQYDENKRLIQENVDGFSINYTYDENGKRTREEIVNPFQITESFTEYEYLGNQVIKTISCNKGNIMANEASGKTVRSAYLISKFEYEYYEDE